MNILITVWRKSIKRLYFEFLNEDTLNTENPILCPKSKNNINSYVYSILFCGK